MHQQLTNFTGSSANRRREFVLPMRSVGRGLLSQAISIFSWPSAVCVIPSRVMGPVSPETLHDSVSAFAMVKPQAAQNWFAVADCDVPWTVMPHQNELLAQVHRVELGVRTARAEPVHDQHGEARLQVALSAGRNSSRSQHGVAQYQAGTSRSYALPSAARCSR